MRKKRDITIKVIKVNNISTRRLAKYFSRKYSEENVKKS